MMKQTSRQQWGLATGVLGQGMTRVISKLNIAKNVGQEIRYHRKKAGYTQTELAQKIGKQLRTVQKYESGEIMPPFYTLTAISGALGTSLNLLMNRHPDGVIEVPIGDMDYEIECDVDKVSVYRQIPEEEYRQWYVGDQNISRRGEIRRLFLIEVPLAQAAETLVRFFIFPQSKAEKE
ncbi:helix-turn-helix domain-containing protein [Ethanoligenens sp.]|uniref:helix-turn-helix domain-containing protein n=1 Tax=Ethanoligenens sp. TaxID=2099655 RepID=UPI0039E845FB